MRSSPMPVPTPNPTRRDGTTDISTRARSRSAVERAKCSATSSPSGCSAFRVNPENVALPAELLAWMQRDDHTVDGWAPDLAIEELHCHPDLVERLSQIARPQRGAARVWVSGCPVVHHPLGAPIACATGTSRLVVR